MWLYRVVLLAGGGTLSVLTDTVVWTNGGAGFVCWCMFQVHAFPVDVRKEQEISSAFDFMQKSVGLPDIIINNAYGGRGHGGRGLGG